MVCIRIMFVFAVVTTQLAASHPVNSSSSSLGLVATFDSGGLRGSVEFLPDSEGTVIRVFLRGGTYGEQFRWKIYEFPPVPVTEKPCSEEKIGRIFLDLDEAYGHLTAGQDVSFISRLHLPSLALGRSLVLRSPSTNRLSCASLQPVTRIRTWRAVLHTPIAGEFIARQSSIGTGIFTQLYWVNGNRSDSLHRWEVVNMAPELFKDRKKELTQCEELHGAQKVLPGNNPAKHILAVSRSPGTITGRTYYPFFDISELDSHEYLFVIIFSEQISVQTILSCARLIPLAPRQALARFEGDINGEISFRQESPFDPTLITLNLSGLRKRAYSYGIDELPLIIRGENIADPCPNVRGVIYNPFGKSPDSVPEPGQGTSDQYAIGDLSGKHGPLLDHEKQFQQSHDPLLPLFGIYSIVGRALVLYTVDGRTLVCANIELTGKRLTTAFATFDYPLQGQVIFRRDRNDILADTSVYVELSHPGPASSTQGHTWGVHERAVPTGGRLSAAGVDCFRAGLLLDPYNISTAGDRHYTCECSAKFSQRCAIGDLGGKLGTLDIPPFGSPGGPFARYYFMDSILPLTGPTGIVGRSLLIREANDKPVPFACANIVEHFGEYGK